MYILITNHYITGTHTHTCSYVQTHSCSVLSPATVCHLSLRCPSRTSRDSDIFVATLVQPKQKLGVSQHIHILGMPVTNPMTNESFGNNLSKFLSTSYLSVLYVVYSPIIPFQFPTTIRHYLHSFVQQTSTGCLLCIRPYSRNWEFREILSQSLIFQESQSSR